MSLYLCGGNAHRLFQHGCPVEYHKITPPVQKYLQRDWLAGVLKYFCRVNVILTNYYNFFFALW